MEDYVIPFEKWSYNDLKNEAIEKELFNILDRPSRHLLIKKLKEAKVVDSIIVNPYEREESYHLHVFDDEKFIFVQIEKADQNGIALMIPFSSHGKENYQAIRSEGKITNARVKDKNLKNRLAFLRSEGYGFVENVGPRSLVNLEKEKGRPLTKIDDYSNLFLILVEISTTKGKIYLVVYSSQNGLCNKVNMQSSFFGEVSF